MSYKLIVTPNFEKDLKPLLKKHKSLKSDLLRLIESLENDPIQGIPLGKNCYKIRLAISSKGKGKSGGARVITHVVFQDDTVYFLSIYDKSDRESLTDKEILELVKLIP